MLKKKNHFAQVKEMLDNIWKDNFFLSLRTLKMAYLWKFFQTM